MAQTIRFHLDEHCDPRIAAGLRRRGINITTTPEAKLLRAADEDHIAFALHEGRVIFTEDSDFLRLHAAGIQHAGIAYCHQQSRRLGEIILGLVLIWDVYDSEDIKNQVVYLEQPTAQGSEMAVLREVTNQAWADAVVPCLESNGPA